MMKAICRSEYGRADVVRLIETDLPFPKDDEVLIRVHAASVNALDRHYMRGEPLPIRMSMGMRRPKDTRLGVDLAGTVESVGSAVIDYKPGDEVFGVGRGAFAEYACAQVSRMAIKPPNVSFEQAAATPVAGITALQGLRDKAAIKERQTVLINGAGGGVGTFAVQIAKVLGAEVTGVTNTEKLEMVRALGADHVVDYKREDFTASGKRYDVIFDIGLTHSFGDVRRALTKDGKWVFVGGATDQGWLTLLGRLLGASIQSPFVSQKFQLVPARVTAQDLVVMGEYMNDGRIKPEIEKVYSLADAASALRRVDEGHTKGKLVLAIP